MGERDRDLNQAWLLIKRRLLNTHVLEYLHNFWVALEQKKETSCILQTRTEVFHAGLLFLLFKGLDFCTESDNYVN